MYNLFENPIKHSMKKNNYPNIHADALFIDIFNETLEHWFIPPPTVVLRTRGISLQLNNHKPRD